MFPLISLPVLVGPILYLLLGVGAVVCGLLAPVGRKGLTLTGGALLLVSGVMDLITGFAYIEVHMFIGGLVGYDASRTVLDVVFYLAGALFGVGVILLVFAATRRLPQPVVGPAPGVPRPPQGPYQPGPAAQR
ncbi:hypothetical protein [Nocardiopsis sp. FIRDI 009]|uniref:hypothetical protein n=1 Tax=Nocardiopsis sp. FIRDI 009 TaxID=714197 RepID=UPI0013009224|nr:hypothetical protein [Nocardiopsis sp. FIRDI 009]